MPENLLTDLKVRSAKSTDRDWKLSDGGGLFLLVKQGIHPARDRQQVKQRNLEVLDEVVPGAAARHREELAGCCRTNG